MPLHRKNKKLKANKGQAVDTGDFGSEAANDANLSAGNKSVGYGGGDGDPRTGNGRSSPTQNVTVPQKKPFQVQSGPVQVPTIGPLSYAFNKISKSLYDRKNLKEARKDDILGGEMLTTGQKKVSMPSAQGEGEGANQLCPDGTPPPCKRPVTQIKQPVKKPNNFLSGFQAYDDGGEVIISGNVDKDLL